MTFKFLTASLPGTAAIFPFEMRGNALDNAYLHNESKNSEIFHEKRDTYVLQVRRKSRMRFGRSERVALFIADERETVQGHRGRLLECVHVVCFPKGCRWRRENREKPNDLRVSHRVAAWHCTQFSPLKCVETHQITHIYMMNQKKAKYSMKSATRMFCEDGANFGCGLRGPNASRFSSRMNTQLCRGVEEDCWSVLMQFDSPKHGLAARKSS